MTSCAIFFSIIIISRNSYSSSTMLRLLKMSRVSSHSLSISKTFMRYCAIFQHICTMETDQKKSIESSSLITKGWGKGAQEKEFGGNIASHPTPVFDAQQASMTSEPESDPPGVAHVPKLGPAASLNIFCQFASWSHLEEAGRWAMPRPVPCQPLLQTMLKEFWDCIPFTSIGRARNLTRSNREKKILLPLCQKNPNKLSHLI